MARIIVTTSGKGGVGKTTTSAAFGTGLALRGHKTVVIDFDVGLRNLDLIMGVERRVVYDFVNVIHGEAQLNQALIRDKRVDGLAGAAESYSGRQSELGHRVYSNAERERLGDDSIGFISFLESAGLLPPPMREMVIDRANAIGSTPLELEDLKIIVLMVFWSQGQEPDALILDELFVDVEDRLIH